MTKPNYTPEMVQMLREAQPIDFDKAQALAKELNRNVRSIIAKVKREGLDYISSPLPRRKKPHLLRSTQFMQSVKLQIWNHVMDQRKLLVLHLINYYRRSHDRLYRLAWLLRDGCVFFYAVDSPRYARTVTLDSPSDRDQNLQSGHIKCNFFDRICCKLF